jgi:hypothetical protein
MADENYLSSVRVGGTDYEIYAKSALSAGWVAASAISGDIPASAITGQISESSISSVPQSALPVIPTSAISDTSIPWSALAPHTAGSGSDATDRLWTPSATREYVTDYVAGKISNVYKFQGSTTIAGLPQHPDNGDVYNLTDNGIINEGTTHSARVDIGDNVAWVSGDGGWWDKLAAVDAAGKLDVTAFEAWSANTNGDSTFAGSAASANTAWVTMNVSGSSGGTTASADGYSLIQSALSGAAASAWISAFESSGKPVWVTQTYLSGDGTDGSAIGLKNPESSIVNGTTQASALVNAGGISSFVDTNYIAKTDIRVENSHQLVIENT